MSCLAVSEDVIIVAKSLLIDCFDFKTHKYINLPNNEALTDDIIAGITVSKDRAYLAVITSVSKQLLIFKFPNLKEHWRIFTLPRSASKIRFTVNNKQILVADKCGDVLIYDVESEDSGTKLLGHLSLLLDVLQTNDKKYIITSDRDEKIRVSCYPNAYNIQTYCLGHKEFTNHIEILPHNDKFIVSSSGDGTIKFWDYINGELCYSIDTHLDFDNEELVERFIKSMDEEGVEVKALPIVHFAVTKLDDFTSLLAVAVHSYNNLLIYSLKSMDGKFSHNKQGPLVLERFPSAVTFCDSSLILYDDIASAVSILTIINSNDRISFELKRNIKMFEESNIDLDVKQCVDSIKVLYKRKFDNVQEYQERKKQRIEKSIK